MKTLNIWEVRAESGTKFPHLDVTANVAAENFDKAMETLRLLIAERVKTQKRIVETAPVEALAEHGIRVPVEDALLKAEDYEVTCCRLLQQVITSEPTPPSCQESSPSDPSAT